MTLTRLENGFMPRFLLTWLITAISLLVTAYLVPGISLDSVTAAAIGAIVLGLINALVRPLILLFTLPLTILTLGLFLFVVNAISFSLVAYFTPGFTIASFWDALFGSIVLSLVSGVFNHLFGNEG
ncbi:MAG: phage holin family protein [Snowella sp.]|jgi:putative membrane protein|nr:phage holin family protein [Snowella sp.]